MLSDHAAELHRRTQGHIGSLTTLIERSCALAISGGVEAITDEILAATTIDNAAQSLSRAG